MIKSLIVAAMIAVATASPVACAPTQCITPTGKCSDVKENIMVKDPSTGKCIKMHPKKRR